jgi:hypothetical protein
MLLYYTNQVVYDGECGAWSAAPRTHILARASEVVRGTYMYVQSVLFDGWRWFHFGDSVVALCGLGSVLGWRLGRVVVGLSFAASGRSAGEVPAVDFWGLVGDAR